LQLNLPQLPQIRTATKDRLSAMNGGFFMFILFRIRIRISIHIGVTAPMSGKATGKAEIASNAVSSTAIRRSSAESLAVRKNEMTKFA
jgi:hypothetical protein